MNIKSMSLKSMQKRLEAEQKRLATRRDALREMVSDFQAVEEDVSDALDSIECAIDALSRLQ